MAPTSTKNAPSSLARALAGMTESVKIPHLNTDPGQLVGVTTKSNPRSLPTPPNSISPSLPPQADADRHAQHSPLTPPGHNPHLDSDIDLDDAVEHARDQDTCQRGGRSRHQHGDAMGELTPVLLATHHLPAILLDQGPSAIRHIMGHLTTSVPGFAGIMPTKARRLVVAALEGRGPDGQVGGLSPDVIFEKVGWGRWSARARRTSHVSIAAAMPPRGLQIPSSHRVPEPRMPAYLRVGSIASDCSQSRSVDEGSVTEHEAFKIGHDDDSFCISPALRPQQPTLLDDLEDMTDEEDWAAVGAAALRTGTTPNSGSLATSHRKRYGSISGGQQAKPRNRGISKRPSSTLGKSISLSSSLHAKQPSSLQKQASRLAMRQSSVASVSDNATAEILLGSQDREAVEALLQLRAV